MADLKLISKSWRGEVDSKNYKHNFIVHEPARNTRSCDFFWIKPSRTDTGKHSVFNRLMTNYNKFNDGADMLRDRFGSQVRKFKAAIGNNLTSST